MGNKISEKFVLTNGGSFMMINQNFNLLADICFHIHEQDKYKEIEEFFDKVPITDSIIAKLKDMYTLLIQKGKKFSYKDIFDTNV